MNLTDAFEFNVNFGY